VCAVACYATEKHQGKQGKPGWKKLNNESNKIKPTSGVWEEGKELHATNKGKDSLRKFSLQHFYKCQRQQRQQQ
jgi:hypothetical protein